MKYLDEFSDPELARQLLDEIHAATTQPLGDHGGLRRPDALDHPARHRPAAARRDRDDPRPGLPGLRDAAGDHRQGAGDRLAARRDLLLVRRHAARAGQRARTCSGSRAQGGDVRVVYSPLDALKIARENPDRQVVFFGIGFETTAPANAMTVYQAKRLGIKNFSLLVSHVLVPPAIAAIMESPTCRVQAFLAAGHVCSVMGTERVPAAGRASTACRSWSPASSRSTSSRASGAPCMQLEAGRHELENAYPRAVQAEGNPPAKAMLAGRLRGHRPGLARHRDDPAERLAAVASSTATSTPSTASRSPTSTPRSRRSAGRGEVLQGLIKPHECAAFGKECTPRNPLGATMVSQRGRVRGVLPVPAARGDRMPEVTPMAEAGERRPSTSKAGSARCRCATARTS